MIRSIDNLRLKVTEFTENTYRKTVKKKKNRRFIFELYYFE